jgi:hypothetical protein
MGYSRLILTSRPFLWQHEPVYGIFSKCWGVSSNGVKTGIAHMEKHNLDFISIGYGMASSFHVDR